MEDDPTVIEAIIAACCDGAVLMFNAVPALAAPQADAATISQSLVGSVDAIQVEPDAGLPTV